MTKTLEEQLVKLLLTRPELYSKDIENSDLIKICVSRTMDEIIHKCPKDIESKIDWCFLNTLLSISELLRYSIDFYVPLIIGDTRSKRYEDRIELTYKMLEITAKRIKEEGKKNE